MVNDESVEAYVGGRWNFPFPSQDGSFLLTSDRVLFVMGLATDLFFLHAMGEAGHKFERRNGTASLFMGD